MLAHGHALSFTQRNHFLVECGLGALAWVVAIPLVSLGVAEAILLFAPLVIVPLGLRLIDSADQPQLAGVLQSVVAWMKFPAALILVSAFVAPRGLVSAMLVLPWLLVTVTLAFWGIVRLVSRVPAANQELCTTAALLFIAVGGSWTLVSRLGWQPLGLDDVIVLLTGVHFHYAGFALPLLAGRNIRAVPHKCNVLLTLGVVFGVPMVGVGITISALTRSVSVIEPASSIVLTLACVHLAILQFRLAVQTTRPMVATLFAISSMSLLAGMALAVIYAVSHYLGTETIDIPTMISLHGLANAGGFSLCGLLAWNVAANYRTSTKDT